MTSILKQKKAVFILKFFTVLALLFLGNNVSAQLLDQHCGFSKNGLICRSGFKTSDNLPIVIKERNNLLFYITPQPKLDLVANQYQFLILRAKVKTDFPQFQINFSDRTIGILSLNKLIFKNNNRFTDYYFNLSFFDQWGGIIDRLYLQFDPNDIEIESFSLSRASFPLVAKSLWQELWRSSPEMFFWINGLPVDVYTLNNLPLVQYFFIIVFLSALILLIIKQYKKNDQFIQNNWQKILLGIFLLVWLFLEVRIVFDNCYRLQKDGLLIGRSDDAKKELFLARFGQNQSEAESFYRYNELIKKNIPRGSKIYFLTDGRYLTVLMVYNLVDQYQLVSKADQADYFLFYNQSIPAPISSFILRAKLSDNKLIYQRP